MQLEVELYTQPPNSPDTNICDLGLFNAIQARCKVMMPLNSVDIVDCVTRAWENYPWQKINHLFLSLQMAFNEIIEHHGSNDFKLPHIGKFRLDKLSQLPVSLFVHPGAAWHSLAMDDPELFPPEPFEDDDLPLPGTIHRAELEWLMEDTRKNDGESDENSSP